jgi:hypothetical protein
MLTPLNALTVENGVKEMAEQAHARKRSFSRLLGQSVVTDAAGRKTTAGAPIEARIAHPYVHELMTKTAGGDVIDYPGYAAVVMLPKLNTDATKCPNYAALATHCMEAAGAAWGSWPEGGIWPIQDGDIPYKKKYAPGEVALTPEQIAERNKWRTGHWMIEVSSGDKYPPQVAHVVDGREVEIKAKSINGQALYKSGDYGYVFLHCYTFHNKKFGVAFGFNGICFTRPGEKIGNSGTKSVASMFGGVGAAVGPGMATATLPTGPAGVPFDATANYAPSPVGAPIGTAPMPPSAAPVAPPAPPVAPMVPGLPPAPPAPVAAAPALPAFPMPG